MSMIDKPERARQLARAIATDLLVYHERELKQAIAEDRFFERMRERIEEGRVRFEKRVTKELGFIYDQAIIDVMVRSQADLPSPMW